MGKSGVEIKLVYNRLPAIAKQLPVEAWQAVRISAAEVMAKAKEKMKESKHGRSYKRGRKMHTASAPGEAPAIDTGNLVNSISAKYYRESMMAAIYTASYGLWLEEALDRPFMAPSVDEEKAHFIEMMRQLESRL